MDCPKCGTQLVTKFYKGMLEVDYCPVCRGMWLDFDELDRLEDVAFADDSHKGSLVHYEAVTEFRCPQCGSRLHEFQYRLYSLRLDYCAENRHGIWLDAAEDERVLEIMQQRRSDVQRKLDSEGEWRTVLKNLHSFFKGM